MKNPSPPIQTIDFSRFEGPVFTGRPRGEQLRSKLKLDEVDRNDTLVDITIPPTVYSVSSSFILGLFGQSIVSMGSSDAFFRKYRFEADAVFKKVIASCVLRALEDKNLFARTR